MSGVALARPVSADLVDGTRNKTKRHWPSQCHTVALITVGLLNGGCSETPQTITHPDQMVYVDTATQTPLTLPIQATIPAPHPKTGKKTLVPGLYCPQCSAWYPAPPVEVWQRSGSPFKCPKGGHPMSPHGPRPPVE